MNTNVMFMPHPPIIIDSIGGIEKEKARSTIEGMDILAKKVATLKPETIIFISPHGNCFSNGTCILMKDELSGDFGQFGHKRLGFKKKVNTELTQKIYDCFDDRHITSILMDVRLAASYNVEVKLDHGVMVPMSFIDQYYDDYRIVHITPGQTPLEDNYYLGKLIRDMVEDYTDEDPSKVLIVASGDMSHALLDSGPYAFNESGPVFDEVMKDAITNKNPLELLKLSQKFIENCAQCGLRSYLMGFGFMDGFVYESKVVSYEGPFGVGYLTGYLESNDSAETKSNSMNRGRINGNTSLSYIDQIKDLKSGQYKERISKEDDYIKLARESIEFYIHHTQKYKIDESKFSKEFLNECKNKRAGAFVSIHKDGQLRGCIGTTESTNDNLLDEIIYNGISACSSDPRFNAIEEKEIQDLEIKVDILGESEPIESMDELDVIKYGVIVEQGYKRGLLLPNLDGIHTVAEQVSIAKQKAAIESGVFKMYRFQVIRHEVE